MLCSCKHEFQDRTYGPGRRVHNKAKSKAKSLVDWVCTVCGDRKARGEEK